MIPTTHKCEPAFTVIERLGGKGNLSKTLKLDRSTLTRWCAPVPIGTGGTIPQRHWPDLLKLAKRMGVTLTLQELVNLKG